MSDKRTTSTRSQRGRAAQPRRGNSRGLIYGILAIIVIVGIALGGVALLGGRGGTTGQASTAAPTLDSFPSRGQAGAPVTVIEYGDFQCPACGYFATTLEPAFVKDYIDTGKVKQIFHDFPLSQHPNAVPAAEAARCAADQNAFWPMHDLIYNRQSEWSDSTQAVSMFAGYAEQLKLDRSAFEQCQNSHKYRATVQQAGQAASNAGINETPTFVIGTKRYSFSDLRAGVDAALAAKK